MGASLQNDGFLEGVTANHDFGAQDDTMLRADLLWEPTDSLSFRFTMNDEERRGTDPRIHSMTRFENSKVLAYNVMLGAFQADADAACPGNPTFAGAPGSQFSYSCGPGGWAPPPAALPGGAGLRRQDYRRATDGVYACNPLDRLPERADCDAFEFRGRQSQHACDGFRLRGAAAR